MRVRVRNHVNPHHVEFHYPRAAPLALPVDREVEVEIGCADAQFLFQRAAADPSREYVGLEIRRDLVAPVNERALALGLPVRAVFAHANIHLRHLFSPASISRVFINFPDPWFKHRHHDRRLVDPPLVDDLAHVLRPGGHLFFQSDVFTLALDAMSVLESSPHFTNLAGPWSFHKGPPPFAAVSRREDTCLSQGLPIWRWYGVTLPVNQTNDFM